MSRVAPLLPVKRSAAAARCTRSPVGVERLAGGRAELQVFLAEHNQNALGAGVAKGRSQACGRRPWVGSFLATGGAIGRLWRGPRRLQSPIAAEFRSRRRAPLAAGALTVCCACSMGLPCRSHFVERSMAIAGVGEIGPPERGVRRMEVRRAGWSGRRGRRRRMGSIGRYIFRTTLGAFLLMLVSLTAVIWVTQAMRDIDLMTSQGQTILVFVGITGLIIPLLVMVIAPIALVIAVAHMLNKLTTDSEIIVMNAAGMSPWRLFDAVPRRRPSWSSILVAAISAYVSPQGLRKLRAGSPRCAPTSSPTSCSPAASPRSSAVSPSTSATASPTACWSASSSTTGAIPKERVTILAEHGEIVKNDNGTFLLLQNGSIQRHETKQRDPSIVRLRSLRLRPVAVHRPAPQVIKYSVRERYLWELIWPDPHDPIYADAARPVPRRIARPPARAALSARLRHHRLRLSRRAAHHAAEPRLVAGSA